MWRRMAWKIGLRVIKRKSPSKTKLSLTSQYFPPVIKESGVVDSAVCCFTRHSCGSEPCLVMSEHKLPYYWLRTLMMNQFWGCGLPCSASCSQPLEGETTHWLEMEKSGENPKESLSNMDLPSSTSDAPMAENRPILMVKTKAAYKQYPPSILYGKVRWQTLPELPPPLIYSYLKLLPLSVLA